jgi:hypothetical protein
MHPRVQEPDFVTESLCSPFSYALLESVGLRYLLDVGNSDSAVNANLNSHFGSLFIMVLLMSMFDRDSPSCWHFPDNVLFFFKSTPPTITWLSRTLCVTSKDATTALQNLLLVAP